METLPGDSPEQRAAEKLMVEAFEGEIGCRLAKQRIDLPNGGCLEVDACDEHRSVLCEAWAHQGPPKSAQKMKVMTDAAKLLLASRIVGGNPRKVLLFADSHAAAWFQKGSWMAESLRVMEIEVRVVDLPDEIRASICKAQERQYR